MILDLRLAIGWLLLAIGFQLVAYGVMTAGRAASMNLTWGAIITLAGAIFYFLARRGSKS